MAWWIPLAAAGVAAAGSVLGGKEEANAIKDSAKTNAESASATNAQQIAFSREMAQNGIQWRVDDAKKAGIHPLYALGAPTFQAPQLNVADTSANTAMGESYARAAEHISRGISSAGDAYAKKEAAADQLEFNNLQKEQLRANIARTRAETQDFVAQSVARSQMLLGQQKIQGIGQSRPLPLHEEAALQQVPVGSEISGAWKVLPNRTNAQSVEDVYGEVGSNVYGIARAYEDALYNSGYYDAYDRYITKPWQELKRRQFNPFSK